MWFAIIVVSAYVAGSMPFGLWLVRWRKGVDIRTVGSGNIGATNVWRVYGRWYGLTVMVLDVAKGFVPAFLATHYLGHLAGVVAGAAAMAGHWRPLFLRFARGGKIVAVTGGAFLGVAPVVGGIGVALWLLVFLSFRYASLASIIGALALAPIAAALGEPWPVIVLGAAAGVGVLVLHRANVARLAHGTENRAALRRRSAAPPR